MRPVPLSFSSSKRSDWARLFTLTSLAAYFYVFMEWLFFVTMPSFMDLASPAGKLETYLLSSLVLCMASLAWLALLVVLDWLLSSQRFSHQALLFVGALLPAGMLAALALLLFDNFTYTVFKLGIVSAHGIWRGVYGLAFVFGLVYSSRRVLAWLGLRRAAGLSARWMRVLSFVVVCLLVISAGLALAGFVRFRLAQDSAGAPGITQAQTPIRRPHILLLGSDGLNAANLSVYGYQQDTTPRLRALAPTSLLAENAFTNAAHSAGSVTSMLTGKLPTQTRMLYPPDILRGADAFQHLPGMLRLEGYHTLEFGVPHYVDAYSVNMQNAFDVVNQRSLDEGRAFRFLRQLGYYDSAYFLSRLVERLQSRLLHIFYLAEMRNPYSLVTEPADNLMDQEKIDQIIDLVIHSKEPVFVHAHLMGTHTPYTPTKQVFVNGQLQSEEWMDANIQYFDTLIGQVVDALEQAGLLEDTLLIVYSDHAEYGFVNTRIPLLLRFPAGEYHGRIRSNVQNLDIAPTILDYMGLPQPTWMRGQSLIRPSFDRPAENRRLIFGLGVEGSVKRQGENGPWVIDAERIHPPFYQFGFVDIIDCQHWYKFSLVRLQWSTGDIVGHTAPCPLNDLRTFSEIKSALSAQLSADGFDVSTLP